MSEYTKIIFNEIKNADKIAIGRHFRPDGDAIGSTHGLKQIIKLSFPEKDVRLINLDTSDYVSFLGPEDEKPQDLSDYLGIVVDCGDMERVSDQDIFKCRKIIKIDHHVDIKPFGDVSWVEDQRPSASEMVASLWYENKEILKLDNYAATCLFTGMVTDTGNFRYGEINSRTMMLAGCMLDMKIDLQTLYARLDLEDFTFYKFQSYVFEKMKITENGVAYLYVDSEMQKKFNLTREQASESVSFMSGIKGSLIWMAFIDNPDNTIRVRLRSRFVEVNKLAEKYHGGGHAMASGATAYSIKEMNEIVSDADKLLKEYKETHKGWL